MSIWFNKNYRNNKDDFYLPAPGSDPSDLEVYLIKDAIKNYKYGYQLLKNGEKVKGATYISFATFEVSLVPTLIYQKLDL